MNRRDFIVSSAAAVVALAVPVVATVASIEMAKPTGFALLKVKSPAAWWNVLYVCPADKVFDFVEDQPSTAELTFLGHAKDMPGVYRLVEERSDHATVCWSLYEHRER